jgi:hypothetical protein
MRKLSVTSALATIAILSFPSARRAQQRSGVTTGTAGAERADKAIAEAASFDQQVA